jgi:CheY-like chemotaxis protein
MIRKMALEAQGKSKSSEREIGRTAIALGMPIQYTNEVAKCAGQAYVEALDITGVPLVDWGLPPQKAARPLGEILVIDDEVVVGNSIRKILEPKGYHVNHVEKPDAAMKKLSEKAVDMVLLDMRIPGVKGFELLSAITGKYPKIPVIMITGYATVKTAVESIRLGAKDYVPKPFTPGEIHQAVQRGLRQVA